MLKISRTCDRCGAIIDEAHQDKERLEKMDFSELIFKNLNENESYDLCDDCAVAFLDWIKNIPSKAPIAKDELKGLQKFAEDYNPNWSPEVLELTRKHNESCEKPKPEVSTSVDKSKIQLKPGTHTYHRWTKEEDQFILYHSAGMTMNELANKFGVTLKAVIHRKHMILNGKVHVEKE